jgi:hypothetical protein
MEALVLTNSLGQDVTISLIVAEIFKKITTKYAKLSETSLVARLS